MKRHRFLSSLFYLLISSFLIIIGFTKPILKMPERLPTIVKEYKHTTLSGSHPGMVNTGIYVSKGNLYSILATGSISMSIKYPNVRPEHGWPLMVRVGENLRFNPLRGVNGIITYASYSGNLYLGIRRGDVDKYGEPLNPEWYHRNVGFFSVDIIVWEKEDWAQIADFFEKMKEREPDNKAIIDALYQANGRKEAYLAKAKALKEIEETKKELRKLKEKPEQEVQRAKPSPVEAKKQDKVAQLETRLSKLTATLAQLEDMKKKFEEERKKTELLSKELAEKEMREKDLLTKLEHGSKTPPVIVIASPKDGSKVEANIIQLSGVAEDDQGLERLEIYINNRPIEKKMGRGIKVKGKRYPRRLDFAERIPLEIGENRIKLRAIDSDGLLSEKILTVHKVEIRKNIWAAVIGIDNYPHVRQLKYAVNDARAFYDHLVHSNQIPAENVTLL
ncbi:hypothetical protein KA005_07730, partial [bacterium]|nr:hypothetical protein [bacterium]